MFNAASVCQAYEKIRHLDVLDGTRELLPAIARIGLLRKSHKRRVTRGEVEALKPAFIRWALRKGRAEPVAQPATS